MQPRVSQAVKTTVIEEWLRGLSRDAIVAKHHLSAGTVTNTVREWRLGLDGAVADELREFAVALKKLRITAPSCAEAARVVSMMTNLGIDENHFYSFMSETYDPCIKMDLKPERIEHILKQLLELSESVPWEQIPDHIMQQVARKQLLEEEVQGLESEALEARRRLDNTLKEEAVTTKELNQFSNFTKEVRKHGISIENLPAFVKTIDGVRQLGYDPKTIVSKLSKFEMLQTAEESLTERVNFLEDRKTNLKRHCADLEMQIEVHSMTISKYKELEYMGFGLKVQKLLWSKIREIGVANQMNPDEAVRKFMKDMELYEDKLGFEPQLPNLKAGIQKSQIMDNILLVVVIFNLISVLATHLEDIKRIEEFRPLVRAAKGEQVPINELKSALIKAIEIMVRALHPVNDSTVKRLIFAKKALEDTLNDII